MNGEDSSKYDLPHGDEEIIFEEEGPLDKVKEYAPVALDLVKRHWWKAAILIIILVVGLFLYDFFIGSYRSVDISVKDTEDRIISGATLRIYDAGRNNVLFEIYGSGIVSLKDGTYPIAVAASGYIQPSRNEINVSGSGSISIVLEKDMDVMLSGDLPTSLIIGEERNVDVVVTNNEAEVQQVQLVFSGGCGGNYMDVSYEVPISVAPGSKTVSLNLRVKPDLDEQEKNCTIRIKGLNNDDAKIEGKINFIEFDSSRIKVSRTTVSFGRVSAGEVVEKSIKLTNNNRNFVMEDVKLRVEISQAQNNTESEVQSWFNFSPSDTIDSIEYGTSNAKTVNVVLSVPSIALVDTIVGTVVIETTYWRKELAIDLDIEAGEVELEIMGIQDAYNIDYEPAAGGYEEFTDQLELKNRGEMTLTGITIVSPPGQFFCDTITEWITINTTEYDSIAPGETKTTPYLISVPNTIPANETRFCEIMVRFNDPINIGERLYISKEFSITTRD